MTSRNGHMLHPDEETDRNPSFPSEHCLIVTTTTGVHAWDNTGITVLFNSDSHGIIASRKASNILAVADGRIVVLHDLDKGLPKRSYRLKARDGCVGLLQYADDTARLYFTTTLQNAVQCYSLDRSELLDAAQTHPSPPNVVALSASSHLLLSASSHPPIIHLTSTLEYSPPLDLRPQCSTSAVVAAAFHPERIDIFSLAFADGTVAVYNAAQLRFETAKSLQGQSLEDSNSFPEIGYITKVHVISNRARIVDSEDSSVGFRGHDQVTGTVSIGSVAIGITAIAFVPGTKATVLTVGADAKCCVIDFAVSRHQRKKDSSRIRIIRSWHLGSPATSAALCRAGELIAPAYSTVGRSKMLAPGKVLAAIGLQNAKVLIFDLEGKLQGQHSFEAATSGVHVVGVEWVPNGKISTRPRRRHQQSSSKSRRKSLDSVLATGRTTRQDAHGSTKARTRPRNRPATTSSLLRATTPALEHRSELSAFSLGRLGLLSSVKAVEPTVVANPRISQPALGHMDIFSPVPSAVSDSTEYQTAKEDLDSSTSVAPTGKDMDKERKRRGIVGTDGMNEESSHSTIVKVSQIPSVPPRPTPKPGGRLYLRRAQTSSTNMTATHHAGPSKHSKSMGVMRTTKRGSKLIQPDNIAGPSAALPTNGSDEAWTDIDLEPPHSGRQAPLSGFNPGSNMSEGSNDTIVDWTTNTSLSRAPPMSITRTTTLEVESSAKPPSPTKPKRPAPSSFDPTKDSKSDDTVVQWSSLKKSPRVLDLHDGLEGAGQRLNGVLSPPPLPSRVAPNLPPRTSQPALRQNNSSSPVTNNVVPPQAPQPHHDTNDLARVLQQSLHRELKLFHRDIMYQFDMQKAWFQSETRDKDFWIQKLQEENGRLRHELNRVRRR